MRSVDHLYVHVCLSGTGDSEYLDLVERTLIFSFSQFDGHKTKHLNTNLECSIHV